MLFVSQTMTLCLVIEVTYTYKRFTKRSVFSQPSFTFRPACGSHTSYSRSFIHKSICFKRLFTLTQRITEDDQPRSYTSYGRGFIHKTICFTRLFTLTPRVREDDQPGGHKPRIAEASHTRAFVLRGYLPWALPYRHLYIPHTLRVQRGATGATVQRGRKRVLLMTMHGNHPCYEKYVLCYLVQMVC